jgi:hypothetical protein
MFLAVIKFHSTNGIVHSNIIPQSSVAGGTIARIYTNRVMGNTPAGQNIR